MAPKNSRIPAYIDLRKEGVEPYTAARTVGYVESGISVAVCRLEARADVQKAVRAAKRAGVQPIAKPKRVGKTAEPDDDESEVKSPLAPWALKPKYASPLELMLDVMNNPKAPGGLRIACAKDAMPYCHARKEGTKKQDEQDKAKLTASKTKFASQAAPTGKNVALRRVA